MIRSFFNAMFGNPWDDYVIRLAFSAARVDGPLNETEKNFLLKIASTLRGEKTVGWHEPLVQSAIHSNLAPEEEIDKLVTGTKNAPKVWLSVHTSLLSLLLADGALNDRELDWFKRLHHAIGTHDDFITLLLRFYHFREQFGEQELARWRSILDVSPGADLETVKKAYRRKASEYHPDKLNGVSAGVKKLAEDKLKEINEAYENLSAPTRISNSGEILAYLGQTWEPMKAMQPGDVAVCSICTQKNRLPGRERFLVARCGVCHAYLGLFRDELEFISRLMAEHL